MSQPEKSDKPSDKKQTRHRHLSGGEELLRGFLMVQESCAEIGNMATPRRFMAFLHCYRQLYKLKKEGIEIKQQHLQVRLNSDGLVSSLVPCVSLMAYILVTVTVLCYMISCTWEVL